MILHFKHIHIWPRRTCRSRRDSKVKAEYDPTRQLLLKLLDELETSHVVVGVGMYGQDIRDDGWPYAASRPEFPGVVLVVDCKHGTLVFACDAFVTWMQNLRAIVTTLQNLKQIEEQEVMCPTHPYMPFALVSGFERWYHGTPFTLRLSIIPIVSKTKRTTKPPPGSQTSSAPPNRKPPSQEAPLPTEIPPRETFDSRTEAATWLASQTGYEANKILSDEQTFILAYRKAARILHPDAGGSAADFRRAGHAKVTIEHLFNPPR